MTTLCGSCQPIFHGAPRLVAAPEDGSYPPEEQRQTHHVSPESLLTALKLGCAICVRVYARITGSECPDGSKILAPARTRRRAALEERESRRCTTWALLRQSRDEGNHMSLVIVADESSFVELAWLSSTFVLLAPDGVYTCHSTAMSTC